MIAVGVALRPMGAAFFDEAVSYRPHFALNPAGIRRLSMSPRKRVYRHVIVGATCAGVEFQARALRGSVLRLPLVV